MTQVSITLPDGAPAWATSIDADDIGGPDEFVRYSAELTRLPDALEPTGLERGYNLVLTAVQFTTAQGDVEPLTPIIEVVVQDLSGHSHRGELALSVGDARALAAGLLAAAAMLEAETPSERATASQLLQKMEAGR